MYPLRILTYPRLGTAALNCFTPKEKQYFLHIYTMSLFSPELNNCDETKFSQQENIYITLTQIQFLYIKCLSYKLHILFQNTLNITSCLVSLFTHPTHIKPFWDHFLRTRELLIHRSVPKKLRRGFSLPSWTCNFPPSTG